MSGVSASETRRAPTVLVTPDAQALAAELAVCLERWCAEAVAARGVFTLALSGGTTPLRLFELLARPAWQDRIDWARTRVFWVDERCVPPSHERSNYGAARRVLFDVVRPGGLFPMDGATEPASAAAAYAACLRAQAGTGELFPALDCVLLGVGEDGHTASLFPGTSGLEVFDSPVAAVWVAAQHEYRLTLTLPLLNAARRCVFMLCGEAKAPMARLLQQPAAERRYPAQMVHGADTVLLLDASAAG